MSIIHQRHMGSLSSVEVWTRSRLRFMPLQDSALQEISDVSVSTSDETLGLKNWLVEGRGLLLYYQIILNSRLFTARTFS